MIIGTIKADKAAAIRSEPPARIFETGAYKGKILQAEQYETKSGAAMLRFYFESNEGATAWLSLCIVKSDGEEAFGMGIFQSMLFCSKTESVEWVEGKVRLPRLGGGVSKKAALKLMRRLSSPPRRGCFRRQNAAKL